MNISVKWHLLCFFYYKQQQIMGVCSLKHCFVILSLVLTSLTVIAAEHEAVVSYHPLATKIGKDILLEGGNAFDAFVATTAAQYVLSEGVTSLSGPLGALIYDAKSKQVVYLDAG